MKRYLHFAFIGLRKYLLVSILMLASMSMTSSLYAQAAESYNDGQLRLRVWLHAVYTDANCSENIINGPTKFIYNKLRVRASNGAYPELDNFPPPAFNNFFPQDMRFRVKGKNTNSFWKVNNGSFQMLNPFYPFKQSTFPGVTPISFPGDTYIGVGISERAPIAPGAAARRPVGIQPLPNVLPVERGYLLMDRTFSGAGAPDRYEWKIDDMFESDADIAGSESVMNIGGLGCKATFGLPQYYEGKKALFAYDPLMTLLIFDSLPGGDALVWGLALGGCINLFGFEIDPLNIFSILVSAVGISDYDDSWASKKNYNNDPAFFRGSTPGEVGYFTTQKVFATGNTDGGGEGYSLVFAHQWEWTGPDSGFPEPSGNVKIQKELCPAEQYTDGPIKLEVWLDGYFTDGDHEGTDIPIIGELLECSDISFGPQEILKEEEKYIRARARTQFTGMGTWAPTVKTRINRPEWIKTNTPLLNNTYSEAGANTFNYEIESWESDCYTDGPTSCSICLVSFASGCCILKVLGSCIIPGIKISADDNDYRATASGTVNWRNSPPNTDNYVYVPVKLSTNRYESHLARLRYKWTIDKPKAGNVDGPRDLILCPGQTHTMNVSPSTNATWYQWQYAVVDGPAGPACPVNPTWIDVPGAICPTNFTTESFTGTRVYRMLVYNRNGPGSRTPNGLKFEYDSTYCTRISILDSIIVPIDAPLACGTAASPTVVRAGSSISVRPVLPPNAGSTNIPGITYQWSSINGTLSDPMPSSTPWETTLTFPSSSPTPVKLTLLTNVKPVCPTATNYDTSCYFITEDPGCSGVTGVIYASHLAAPSGGIGTINKPYTLAQAFGYVSNTSPVTHVKILAGNYVIDSTNYGAMKLSNNLVVEGNYVEIFDATLGENIWVKRSNATTNIISNITERINDPNVHTVGFRSIGDNWVLQDINITTGNAPDRDALSYKYASPQRGLSNYAIHIHNSTGWKLINVNAVAGQAGKGSAATPRTEYCPEATRPAAPAANSPGYGAGGMGSNNLCTTENRSGGDGGPAGSGGGAASYSIPGSFGTGGAYPGGNGNTGRVGDAGSSAAGVILADLASVTYYPAKGTFTAPTNPNRGHVGGGGGGGAGSATVKGAAGGLGGLGGLPGWGSGGAFGLWISGISNGSATNIATGVTVLSAQVGGDGGEGMPGYPGGLAPAGVGNGGVGGKGGVGAMGPTGGVAGFNTPQFVSATSAINPGGPNYPGERVESDYTSGCTNSEITIEKFGAINWGSLPDGAVDYPNLRPGQGTTAGAIPNPKFIYFTTGSLGSKDIPTSAEPYQNQIYVRYERPLPTITVPNLVCFGTPVSLSSTSGMAAPIDHEWVIQQDLPVTGIYTSPVPVYRVDGVANPSGIILPNSTAASIFYQVRYRVRDNCCGWSIPIYSTIEVLPKIDNIIGNGPDTTIVCNVANPSIITTNPGHPIPSGSWTYQWYQSFNGGAYTPIIGEMAVSYDPDTLKIPGTYKFKRVIGSTVAVCGDSSNVITIIVTENFKDNNISFPVPFIAACGPLSLPQYNDNKSVGPTNYNIGLMSGSVPTGPGDVNTFYYQWQTSPTKIIQVTRSITVFDSINPVTLDSVFKSKLIVGDSTVYTWTNITAPWPKEGGTHPVGIGPMAQNWDPGVDPLSIFSYGVAEDIFPQDKPGAPGLIQFRRIVQRVAGDFDCADTSNMVSTEVYPGRKFWGNCPLVVGYNNTVGNCNAFVKADTAKIGYQGTCAIMAPDTVCPGIRVELDLATIRPGSIQLIAESFVWYSVLGGPYNNTTGGGNRCVTNICTNPLMNDGCPSKPIGAAVELLATVPFDSSGNVLSVVLNETTTFYVNGVDRCFSDPEFRAAANPELYITQSRWQRKTIIVITPPTPPVSLTASDSVLCDGIYPPDSIKLTINGGALGNAGHFVMYDTDPTVGKPTPIFVGAHTIDADTTRNFTVVRPTVPKTYYARIENRCDTTDAVSVSIIINTPSTAPTALNGPDVACDETIVLTVVGGSLGTNAEWVLYSNPTFTGIPIARNITGIFSVTPTADITYYVRAESPLPCLNTTGVSHFVLYSNDCVCDINPGIIEYAPTGVTTIATIECEGTDGWTYYAETSKPEIYLFAIQKRPGIAAGATPSEAGGNTVMFNATCSLTVTLNPTAASDVFFAENLAICEGNFVMPRYWNVTYQGGTPTLDGFIRTRFFFPPAELAATLIAATAWKDAYDGTCGLPLAVGPAQVFKTTSGQFDPRAISGKVPIISDVMPTTIKNFNYVASLLSSLPHGDTYPQALMGKNYVQTAWTGFSGGGVAIRVSPYIVVLPITLLYFTGSMVEDKVYLDWETASELNNDYFIVEKSADAVNWSSIGSVDGNGTTNIPHQYQLIDGQPFIGKNYYRLKQVDFDGTISYSRVIVIEVNNSKTSENSFTVLPNPTAGPIVATIVSSIDQNVNMRILDISGRLMGNKDISLAKGVNQLKLDLTKYPAATYILSYTDKDGKEFTAKVVKQ